MAEYCVVRQQVGYLVKTYATDRWRFVQYADAQTVRPANAPAMWQKSADKLELYLALFGYTGTHYILTFDDEHLPDSFAALKQLFAAFVKRVRRFNSSIDRYVYAVEAGHSRGRWHIHFVADDFQLPFAAVQVLWRYGWVNPGYVEYPVLHKAGGYRRLAEYFCKDRDDGFIPLGKHRWGVARGMRAMIPPPTVSIRSRRPAIPKDPYWINTKTEEQIVNDQSFGRFYKASWIAAPKQNFYFKSGNISTSILVGKYL